MWLDLTESEIQIIQSWYRAAAEYDSKPSEESFALLDKLEIPVDPDDLVKRPTDRFTEGAWKEGCIQEANKINAAIDGYLARHPDLKK